MPKVIYITDITLHAKDFRPTPSLAKAEEKKSLGFSSPRFYSNATKLDATVEGVNTDGTFKFAIDLPPDLAVGVENGEIELRELHPGATLVYAGKDVYEKLAQIQNKERRELIHRSRKWRKK
jgi:hypothetical protein